MRDSFIDESSEILLVRDMRDRGVDASVSAIVRCDFFVEVEMNLRRYSWDGSDRARLKNSY